MARQWLIGMHAVAPSTEAFELRKLPLTVPRSGVSDAARQALRQLLGDVDRELAAAFRGGADVRNLVKSRSRFMDNVLSHVWNAWLGDPDQAALFAVGGYGRGELFPHSDVDLLIVRTEDSNPALLRRIEAFFTTLWDLGLKLGSAVRTIEQCFEVARQEITVYTALLEARRISGSVDLEGELRKALKISELWSARTYLETKAAEQKARHARFHDTTHNLEPNIKDGPGGLRSLHLIAWLGRRFYDADSLNDLIAHGLLNAEELAALESARAELWRIRYGLHLTAGRAEDRLLFDFQRELASQFGYRDQHQQNLGVEQFMQIYFRAALSIERLNEQTLQLYAEMLDGGNAVRRQLSVDFSSLDGRLDSDDPRLLMDRPSALIDLFRVWSEHPELKGLRSTLIRRIRTALEHHGTALPANHQVNAAFLRLLRNEAIAAEALTRMNQYGVLAHYLPAFGKVVGRMQYDLFHMYTVDEHTLRVLRFVAHFSTAAGSQEFPFAHQIKARLVKPELLLLAALFHDIAKGRGGDHSELGERDAREFCSRLQLSEPDTELVAWLVRWHLLMSTTAQRQDITDPDVVHHFAVQVAEWERLDYLYLLTVADIAGTSSKLWNSWKDRLLSDLYVATRYVLRRELEPPPHAEQRIIECQARAIELLGASAFSKERATRLWMDFPAESFLRYSPAQIAWQTKAIADTDAQQLPLVIVNAEGARGCSEIFIYSPDRDGLFAAVTATLDRMQLDVQEARVVNSTSGFSLDTFLVLDAHGKPLDRSNAHDVCQELRKQLSQTPLRAKATKRALPRRLRHFHIATQIEFFQDPASPRTHASLVCSDRPGLLAAVALAFRNSHVRVHDARIATFGERVEDFFQITDELDRPITDERVLDDLRASLFERIDAQLGDSPRAGTKTRNSHVGT